MASNNCTASSRNGWTRMAEALTVACSELILGGQKTAPLQPLVDELADLVELAFTD